MINVWYDEDYFYRLSDKAGDFNGVDLSVSDETAANWRGIEKAFWDMQDEICKLRREQVRNSKVG